MTFTCAPLHTDNYSNHSLEEAVSCHSSMTSFIGKVRSMYDVYYHDVVNPFVCAILQVCVCVRY